MRMLVTNSSNVQALSAPGLDCKHLICFLSIHALSQFKEGCNLLVASICTSRFNDNTVLAWVPIA
jgi:hypothetical protein